MASASVTMTITPLKFQEIKLIGFFQLFSMRSCNNYGFFHQNAVKSVNFFNIQNPRLSLSCKPHMRRLQHVLKPITAVDSGLEVSITDPEDLISVKDAKIVVESQDEDKIQVRVDVTGDGTQKVFDKVLTNLARSAPPIPGFRREKGGKTTKVPKDFLLQILGEERVTKFVIEEIVSSTMTDYSKKENLNVKEKKVTTSQSREELRKLFTPGKEFGFNAVMELEKPEVEESDSEESGSSSSDVESEDVSVA
ncbi:Trigger factor like [Melia azedarach]|uniref:Trigger factor like n=1 Tax=Melia azedarach TaxID=155640 RepID=A0ACC1YJF4_MELAZ|nr:Trigger factor like [Melia azedarach]